MNRIKLVLCGAMGMLLGSACSESTEPEAAPEPWNITVSRADGGAADAAYNRIWVRGDGSISGFGGVLDVSGTTGVWEGTAPVWPETNGGGAKLYAVSPVPENGELPREIDLTAGTGTVWLMDYQEPQTKPVSLTMDHLLAKLVVHIRIDGETNPEPTDGSIRLFARGTIDYPERKVTATAETADVRLGIFHQEGQDEHSTEHNWEMETAMVVIPQELPAGEPCLWFTAGGREYTFTPLTPLQLEVGKVNNLYLGVAVGGPVMLQSVTVTSWDDGGTINAGEAEETDGV